MYCLIIPCPDRSDDSTSLLPVRQFSTWMAHILGNPELYDPTDMCQPTVGRLTGDSWATNGPTVLQGVSPDSCPTVGEVLV